MGSHRTKRNWHFNEYPEDTFSMLLMSVGYHTNVGINYSCQDKCQPMSSRLPVSLSPLSPCPSPSLWWWVYYNRVWKFPSTHRFLSSGMLLKVWFWERFGSQIERSCWVWDVFSGLVGWPLPASLNIWLLQRFFFINNLFNNPHQHVKGRTYEYVGQSWIICQFSFLRLMVTCI